MMKTLCRKALCLSLCLLLCLLVTACAESTGERATAAPTAEATKAVDTSALTKAKDTNEAWDSSAVAVTLNGTEVSIEGAGAVWDAAAATLTFTAEGDYLLSGELTGSLVVSATKEEDVRLILNGVTVASPVGPALYVQSADKVILTLAEGSINAFSDAVALADGADTISSCLYSKDDLSLNGAGSLTVTGNVKNGIVCKNDLLLVNGSLTVTAPGNGVRGKDSLTMLGGSLTVQSGGDALVSDSDDEAAPGSILVAGGTLELVTGGGAGNAAVRTQYWGRESAQSNADSVSMKGLKATGSLTVQGGTLSLDCADDALHADSITVLDGTLSLATGDDGLHADSALAITGGSIAIRQSYEGLEATEIAISGGDIRIVASDDGVNAAGGNDSSAMQGFGGFDRFGVEEDALIAISGGVLTVNAEGDGLDSNGSITLSGGEVYISGPTNSGNGALDYGGACTVTGGVLVAAGASGMAQNASEGSTQAALLVSGASGGAIVLTDANGSVLLTYTPEKSYDCVVLSCPGMAVGGTYTVTCGGSAVYTGTLTQTVTGGGFSDGWGGMPGGFGGGGGKPGGGGGRR